MLVVYNSVKAERGGVVEIERLIYNHKDRLYRLCLYLEKSQDRAEELFQDTWVKAIEKWDAYDTQKAFYPWLTQIAVNTYRDRLRKLKRELLRFKQLEDIDGVVSSGKETDLEDAFLEKESLKLVMKHIKELPDKYKLPLILVFSEQLSYKAASEILGIEEKLVKSRLYDARQKLKAILKKEGYDD